MSTATVNLVEIRAVEPMGLDTKVDRAAGVVRGVKVMGVQSVNRIQGKPTRYAEKAFKEAAALYNHRPVHLDHRPRNNPEAERSVTTLVGHLENITARPDGLYGDLHVLKDHPHAGIVFGLAERASRVGSGPGLSHDAQGAGLVEGEEFVVSEIKSVRSVDIVAEPATTRSFFESMEAPMSAPAAPATTSPAPSAPAVTVTTGTATQTVTVTEDKKPEPSPTALLEQRIAKLEAENDTLKAAAATRARQEKVDALLVDAKLPATAVTPKFRELLVGAKDDAEVQALIEDRRVAVRHAFHQNPSNAPTGTTPGHKTVETATDFVESLRASGGRS